MTAWKRAALAVYTAKGYQGQIMRSYGYKVDTEYRCPHMHKYKDCAEHCAAKAARRYHRTNRWEIK